MLTDSESKLDRSALKQRLEEQIPLTEAILASLLSAAETPTILQARLLYSEELTRLQNALGQLPDV